MRVMSLLPFMSKSFCARCPGNSFRARCPVVYHVLTKSLIHLTCCQITDIATQTSLNSIKNITRLIPFLLCLYLHSYTNLTLNLSLMPYNAAIILVPKTTFLSSVMSVKIPTNFGVSTTVPSLLKFAV
jgi:hypothetical protein